MKSKNEKLNDEFQLFLSSDEQTPPLKLSDEIREHVRSDLNPAFSNVLIKVLGIHTVVSLLSLSLCSQFGFQTLPLLDLMNHFMSVAGPVYCMAFCGALYLGISALALSLLLRPEEIRIIRKHVILQMTLLSGISLGVFLCLGASMLLLPVALWTGGAIAGGIGIFEAGWMMRAQFRKRLIYGV